MPGSTSTRRRRLASATPAVRTRRLDASSPINSWGERLKTRYNSMQVALNKRMSHGFLFKGAYTLAKAMNEKR